MSNFVEAMPIENLPAGKCTTVTLEGKQIAVYNVDGNFYATADACTHAGASLGWGLLDGTTVKCRAHGLCYNVTTGKIVGSDVGVQSYRTKVEDGKVFVEI